MTEHDFQVNIVNTLKRLNVSVYAIPNSQILMKKASAKDKYFIMKKYYREGFKLGFSDLIVLHKSKVYFVEVKKPATVKLSEKTGKQIKVRAGVQSDVQRKFQKEVEAEGHQYWLIDSHKKFEEFLSYLKS